MRSLGSIDQNPMKSRFQRPVHWAWSIPLLKAHRKSFPFAALAFVHGIHSTKWSKKRP